MTLESLYTEFQNKRINHEEFCVYIRREYKVESCLDFLISQFGYKDRDDAYEHMKEFTNPPLMNLND